jgi:hypothetical protein
MKNVLILSLLILPILSKAQSTVENFKDISGQPFFPKTYHDVNGTPFLFDDWAPSTVTLSNGTTLRDIKTNFNIVTDELLYIDERGKTMVANATVIKKVEANAGTLRMFVTTKAKNTYFEIVSTEGKATLLKHHKKVVLETKPYNSATVQKNFITDESLVLSLEGDVIEVKSVNDLYKVLTPSEPLKEFAKKERLKNRSVDSWIRIVDHYNSIETRMNK